MKELFAALEKELGLQDFKAYIDQRSHYFFYLTNGTENLMVLVKEEFEEELFPPLRRFGKSFSGLPVFLRETPSFMLFELPAGKLSRLTEEKITEKIQAEAVELQKKLNVLLEGTGYNWVWELNYFFQTQSGIMYIDLETIEENAPATIFKPSVYEELTVTDRVLLKIEREKKKRSWKE